MRRTENTQMRTSIQATGEMKKKSESNMSYGPVLSPKDQSCLPRTSPLSQGQVLSPKDQPAWVPKDSKCSTQLPCVKRLQVHSVEGSLFSQRSLFKGQTVPLSLSSSLERQTSGHAGEAEHHAGQPHMLLKSSLVYASLPKSA